MDSNTHQIFPSSDRTLVFIATYNEVDNIHSLLTRIWGTSPNTHILVIDDNSPDGTGLLLDKIRAENNKLKVIHRPRKNGLGTAHHQAMIYAFKYKYDVLVTMDGDHSHDPSDIPRLLKKLEEADFVIGSRYMKGGTCNYNGYRKYLSISANLVARYTLGIKLSEFTNSFRAFRVSSLAKVNFLEMRNQGYSFFMESVYRFHQAGLKLTEIPICFHNRNMGNSKIPPFEIFRGIFKLFQLVSSRILRRKSL